MEKTNFLFPNVHINLINWVIIFKGFFTKQDSGFVHFSYNEHSINHIYWTLNKSKVFLHPKPNHVNRHII